MVIGGKVDGVITAAVDLEVQSDCLKLYPNPTNGFSRSKEFLRIIPYRFYHQMAPFIRICRIKVVR